MSFNIYNPNVNDVYRQTNKVSATIITLEEMKLYLKVDTDDEDALITAMISAATLAAEKYMKRDLLETTYQNYRDCIEQDLTLRRAGFASLESFEYLKNGSYSELDSSKIKLADYGIYGRLWEVSLTENYDVHPQAIKITFKTGFGASGSDIPDDIILGIKAHVAFLYENRGDCPSDKVPMTSAIFYNAYKVIDINGVY